VTSNASKENASNQLQWLGPAPGRDEQCNARSVSAVTSLWQCSESCCSKVALGRGKTVDPEYWHCTQQNISRVRFKRWGTLQEWGPYTVGRWDGDVSIVQP
jgi:hypothetical protein